MAAKKKPTKQQVRKAKSAAKKTVKAAERLGISPTLVFLLFLIGVTFVYSSYLELGSDDVPIVAAQNFINKDADLAIHYIDVGQGDCSLIMWEGASMLIDSGESQYAETVLDYLDQQGIEKLDYVVATHPHSDHMGSMSEIISNVEVGKVIVPKVAEGLTPTTVFYEKFLTSLSAKAIKLTAAKPGTSYTFSGTTAASVSKTPPEFEILGPVTDYDDLNNYSVVVKLTYGETSYLFTGDIEKKAENDILEYGADVDADVLKSAHHGSSTSSGDKFIDAVSPEICIIQCGDGNDYGHPHAEVVELLDDYGVTSYRTDRYGTIIVYSDGKQIYVATEKE